MSRQTIYQDSRLTLVTGTDPVVGMFYQIFDKDMQNETPEGEGLILDWSELFGYEVNYTGIITEIGIRALIEVYISCNGDSEAEFNLDYHGKN